MSFFYGRYTASVRHSFLRRPYWPYAKGATPTGFQDITEYEIKLFQPSTSTSVSYYCIQLMPTRGYGESSTHCYTILKFDKFYYVPDEWCYWRNQYGFCDYVFTAHCAYVTRPDHVIEQYTYYVEVARKPYDYRDETSYYLLMKRVPSMFETTDYLLTFRAPSADELIYQYVARVVRPWYYVDATDYRVLMERYEVVLDSSQYEVASVEYRKPITLTAGYVPYTLIVAPRQRLVVVTQTATALQFVKTRAVVVPVLSVPYYLLQFLKTLVPTGMYLHSGSVVLITPKIAITSRGTYALAVGKRLAASYASYILLGIAKGRVVQISFGTPTTYVIIDVRPNWLYTTPTTYASFVVPPNVVTQDAYSYDVDVLAPQTATALSESAEVWHIPPQATSMLASAYAVNVWSVVNRIDTSLASNLEIRPIRVSAYSDLTSNYYANVLRPNTATSLTEDAYIQPQPASTVTENAVDYSAAVLTPRVRSTLAESVRLSASAPQVQTSLSSSYSIMIIGQITLKASAQYASHNVPAVYRGYVLQASATYGAKTVASLQSTYFTKEVSETIVYASTYN